MKKAPTTERLIVEDYQSSPNAHLIYLMHLATTSIAWVIRPEKRY